MGFYLNSVKPAELYNNETKRPYFVDKTRMLEELFPLVDTGTQYVCITRPRRFGKTIMANMIGAFFGKAKELPVFERLEIAKAPDYKKYKHQYNVVYIDFSKVNTDCESYSEYIAYIKDILRDDLHEAFPDVRYRQRGDAAEDFMRITQSTGEKFIFVFDEWDYIFHRNYVTDDDKARYVAFLSNLLKDQPYVKLVYMTGILPITKYSSGSELNMFKEYTMNTQSLYSDYFGFTEKEVDELYARYRTNNKELRVDREGLRKWYDGYHTLTGKQLYNPRSIVFALENNQLSDYWTSSGPYDEIFYYVKNNIADVRNDIAKMVAGESVPAEIQEYSATSSELKTRAEILSAMVVYGFLTFDNGCVSIPNRELMNKFSDMVKKEESLGYIYRLAKESDRMLAATKAGDVDTMVSILQHAHDTETGMTGYNDEFELSAIIKLVYLSARDRYDIQREDKAGIGYVDYIFTRPLTCRTIVSL